MTGLAALCVIAWNANAREHSGQSCYRVNVQLSSPPGVPRDLLRDGEGAASTIFAGIHVQLVWREPTRHKSKALAGCAGEPAPPDLALEIVPHAPPSVSNVALAVAMPYADFGVRAAIFYDRVEPLLRLSHAPEATLLGYVLAHEIAHVLQGIARHSETGVMRAHWTDSDFEQMRNRVLPFAAEDVQLIRQRLALRDTPAGLRLIPAAICDALSPKVEP